MSSEPVIIKKRNRPQTRVREKSIEQEPEEAATDIPEDEKNLPLEDLIELRKLRRSREGIDVGKLNKGDPKKKRRKAEDEATSTPTGLIKSGRKEVIEEEDDQTESKARRSVRTSNFTQQTNALDVDKHMMAYIEENMKLRHGSRIGEEDEEATKPKDPQEELFRLESLKYKSSSTNDKKQEEGSVTNSLAMLTAIPEVDLGMDARLKNIEDTEKAKRAAAESRKEGKRRNNDEEHLAATRFFKPNHKQKSDVDILRDAQLEAMGLRPEDHEPRRNFDRPQVATDEMVMERFKKRMRR